MTRLPPLNSLTFFCRAGIHPATDCRCKKPVEVESFWRSLTATDIKWAIFAIAALIVFVAIGVTQ